MTAAEAAAAHAERAPESTRTRTVTWQDPARSPRPGPSSPGSTTCATLATGELPPAPIAVLMRMAPVEIEPGRAVFEGAPGEEHYNPIGVVHGGYAATLLDSALGCAVHTTLEPGVGYTTLTPRGEDGAADHRCDRGASAPRARSSTAAAARRPPGRELTDKATGKLLAHGTATCMILA